MWLMCYHLLSPEMAIPACIKTDGPVAERSRSHIPRPDKRPAERAGAILRFPIPVKSFFSLYLEKLLTMKKLFFLTALCGLLSFLHAQSVPKFVYAEIVGESRFLSNKVTVSIDYGQATSFFENTKVKNEDGSNRKFNSMSVLIERYG